METIIAKIIVCSGVLLGLYYVFLSKEKTLVFNRFYLIFSLVFSVCVPFFTIERPQPEGKTEIIFAQETTEQFIVNQPNTEQTYDFSALILLIYFAVATLFLAKLVYSLIKIKTLKGQKTIYKSRKVFLLEKDLAPFSFWNTIYVSGKDFSNEEINHNIFLHEETHIRQKHSLDLLFTELLKIVFWFNPFIYFYKKAIINNHEFLADEGVIEQNKNIKTYQELILNEILKQHNPELVHPFNFNNTKNRFIMMTKQNSKFGKAKRFMAIPVFAIATFAFAEKVYGNNVSNTPKLSQKNKTVSNTNNNESDENTDKNPITINEEIKNDTISPKKAVEPKIAEVKSSSSKEKTVTDIAIAPLQIKNQIPAEFPGGANALRKSIAEGFDISFFENKTGTISTAIIISVDENGKTTDVKANGDDAAFNNEAVRTVKLATNNKTWKPATENGKPAKSVFKLPLKMQFETATSTKTQ